MVLRFEEEEAGRKENEEDEETHVESSEASSISSSSRSSALSRNNNMNATFSLARAGTSCNRSVLPSKCWARLSIASQCHGLYKESKHLEEESKKDRSELDFMLHLEPDVWGSQQVSC